MMQPTHDVTVAQPVSLTAYVSPRESAKIALENVLLKAVVDGQHEEIKKLQRQLDWLSLENAGLRSKVETEVKQ